MSNPSGLCKCGCGGKTPLAKSSSRKAGRVKGESLNYIRGHYWRGRPKPESTRQKLSAAHKGQRLSPKHRKAISQNAPRGRDNHAYNGGLWIEARSGRCYIRCRNGHPYAYYRAVMELHLRRVLRSDEQVHHINGDPSDDRIENLQLLSMDRHSSITNKKYTREDLIAQLRRYHEQTGRVPTLKEIQKAKMTANPKTFQAAFGSWSAALSEAGLA